MLPPANEVCEGYVFTGVCLSTGGACMVAHRGGVHGCLGGMCGCSWGACVVAPGGHVWLLLGGHAWLLPGGHAWLLTGGVCMVAHGGGHVWLLWGEHAWLLMGGMHGCSGGGMRGFFNEIRSMSRRYASYWNAFLLQFCEHAWLSLIDHNLRFFLMLSTRRMPFVIYTEGEIVVLIFSFFF